MTPKPAKPAIATKRRENPDAWMRDVCAYFEKELEEDEVKRFKLNVEGVAESLDHDRAKKIYLTQLLLTGPYAVSGQLGSGFLRRHLEFRALLEAAHCVEHEVSFDRMEKCLKRLEKLKQTARVGSSKDALKAGQAACEGKARAATKFAVQAVWQYVMRNSTLDMDRYLPHRRAGILALSEIFILSLQQAGGFGED